MAEAEFVAFLIEQLRSVGAVRARRMFGGYGVYLGPHMFGLVADGTLYLKTDEGNRAEFEAADQQPFVYDSGSGKRAVMSYYSAPEESIEDTEQLARWAQSALAAARRSGTAAKKKSAAPRKTKTRGQASAARSAAKKKGRSGGGAATRKKRAI